MSNCCKRPLLIGAFLVGILGFSDIAAHAAGPAYGVTTSSRITRKLMRGIGNVCFGFVEIPRRISDDTQMIDPFTGTFTGLVKGLGWTVARMGVGVYEVATFPFPTQPRYEPIIEPEFVLMDII